MVSNTPNAAGSAEAPRGASVDIRDVTVTYRGPAGDTVAVDDVSFRAEAGDIVALLGASGSGKSSLLRAVAGLESAGPGRIIVGDTNVTTIPVHLRDVGMMFQDAQLFPHRDVAGNIAYGLQVGARKYSRREVNGRVGELLDLVGLTGMGARPITTLSGGQAQRVALARSLAPRPRVLLLDEPLSALDRALREHLSAELGQILRSTGTTALYVTHDHDEAFAVADRVGIMGRGQLWQIDSPRQLWQRPAGEEVALFLGYGPVIDGQIVGTSGRVALAPGGLRVVQDDDGIEVEVLAGRLRRGRAELVVTLSDGQRAIAAASLDDLDDDGAYPRGTARVRADRAAVVHLDDAASTATSSTTTSSGPPSSQQ